MFSANLQMEKMSRNMFRSLSQMQMYILHCRNFTKSLIFDLSKKKKKNPNSKSLFSAVFPRLA